MAKEEIEIEISRSGEVTIRTVGIKGPRCLEQAEAIAQIIGREQNRELTPEYYEAETDNQTHLNLKQKR